jgi:hypothetical protein
MKKLASIAGLALVLALTGCQAPAETTSTTTPSDTPSATPAAAEESPLPVPSATRNENERGQLVKKVGEQASTMNEAGEIDFKMKVTGFDFIECDGIHAQEMDGYVLAVSVEMETTKDFVGNSSFNDAMGVLLPGAYSWTGYEPDGTKMSDLNGGDGIINCFDDGRKLFPEYVGKGEKAKGQVLLNVTTKSGEVAFDPFGIGGWVWEYPEKGSTV